MKWILKTVFISLYFLPLVLLFERINPYSHTKISEASAYILLAWVINLITLRLGQVININTRFLVFVISILIYDYLLIHLLINKYEQVLWSNGYLYPVVLFSLNITFFGIYKSYFLPNYGGVDDFLKNMWRGKLRSDYVVMSTGVNLIASFIFTLWIGNILNENSFMKFFHYFVYGQDTIFNLNAWFIQPPIIISIAIYIALQMRAYSSSSQKTSP